MKKLVISVLLALSLLYFVSCGIITVEEISTETSSQETPSQEPLHVCTPAATVIENKVDATCENEGSYDEVVYCAGCDKELPMQLLPRPSPLILY